MREQTHIAKQYFYNMPENLFLYRYNLCWLDFLQLSYFQEQYKFIYDTLEEYCRGIDSRFPVSDLANKIKEKTQKDKKIKKNAYATEYAVRRGNARLPVHCSPSSPRVQYE